MIHPDDVDAASDKFARRRRSPRTIQCLALALVAGAAFGQAPVQDNGDPLHSAECESAQLALERGLQEAAGGNAAAREGLGAAREKAKEACLGRQAGHTERSGAPASPIMAPAPAPAPAPVPAPVTPEPRAAAAPDIIASPPPSQAERPVPITSCDPGGCWDSQGRRLNFMGPVLIGPQGSVCTVQGSTVQCPQ
jgi:hypothetical protein